MREREREGDRQTERERERDRDRDKERERERERRNVMVRDFFPVLNHMRQKANSKLAIRGRNPFRV